MKCGAVPGWLERHRAHLAEQAQQKVAKRRQAEADLAARSPILEAAASRAEHRCACGGPLLPTGYFCPDCTTKRSPEEVLSLPLVVHEDGSVTATQLSDLILQPRAESEPDKLPRVFRGTSDPPTTVATPRSPRSSSPENASQPPEAAPSTEQEGRVPDDEWEPQF
jgi:hypothetical protein